MLGQVCPSIPDRCFSLLGPRRSCEERDAGAVVRVIVEMVLPLLRRCEVPPRLELAAEDVDPPYEPVGDRVARAEWCHLYTRPQVPILLDTLLRDPVDGVATLLGRHSAAGYLRPLARCQVRRLGVHLGGRTVGNSLQPRRNLAEGVAIDQPRDCIAAQVLGGRVRGGIARGTSAAADESADPST